MSCKDTRLLTPHAYDRCVAIFPDQTGFCVGSVEGRVAIEYIQDSDLAKNFAFKCHRQDADSKQPEVTPQSHKPYLQAAPPWTVSISQCV